MENKKTIFVYIYGYLPAMGYGGPVTSISNFTEHFGDEYDIRVVTSDHEHSQKEKLSGIQDGWNKVGKASVLYLNESHFKKTEFYNLMKQYDVAMVYLTGVFSFVLNDAAISAARKLGIKVVIATRGEILKNILAMKSWKKLPYLRLLKSINYFNGCYFQITSDEEHEQLVQYLAIPEDKIVMLPNLHGTHYDLPSPLKNSGEARIMFISRIHPKKNLLDAIDAAIKAKGDITFDIYGPIEDEEYWKQCQISIGKAPTNIKINYRGGLSMMEARKVYYGYHAFIFPTLSENYGHVIVEAMIAGCLPVISRGTTPWDDMDGNGGYVVPLHDIDALTKAVSEIAEMSQEKLNIEKNKLMDYQTRKLQLNTLLDGYSRIMGGVLDMR